MLLELIDDGSCVTVRLLVFMRMVVWNDVLLDKKMIKSFIVDCI